MIELAFNKKIYRANAVQEAVALYGHLAQIDQKSDSDYYRLTLTEIDQDVADELPGDLANFVLIRSVEGSAK